MSLYRNVPAKDPAYEVQVGYQLDAHAFYWEVWDTITDDLVSVEHDVHSLYDLVAGTWGYVQWTDPEAQTVLKRLRDDLTWVAEAKQDAKTALLRDLFSVG